MPIQKTQSWNLSLLLLLPSFSFKRGKEKRKSLLKRHSGWG
jgi:hypothetical protein